MDDPDNYLASFYMFDYIGGRYSATSMVGLVTLGFALGYDAIMEFLVGAHAMDLAAEEPKVKNNIPLLLALLGIWNHNFLGHASVAVLPYSQALTRFPAHLQQCDMESNGKSTTRRGAKVAWQTGTDSLGGAWDQRTACLLSAYPSGDRDCSCGIYRFSQVAVSG